MRVGFYVTCLVNTFRPSVAFASIKLLEQAGCEVVVPKAQSCCGQPGYNPGDDDNTRDIARQLIDTFFDFDYVVLPSGSCAGMIKHHYAPLFEAEPEYQNKARQLAEKVFEITQFLHDVLGVSLSAVDSKSQTFTYHDSCAGLRELSIKQQPRALLQQAGVSIQELANTEECCGFGGTFCAKMPDISTAMADDKLVAAEATKATTLLGGDMGCLLNLSGRAKRENKSLQCRHVIEVLADELDKPAIGEPES